MSDIRKAVQKARETRAGFGTFVTGDVAQGQVREQDPTPKQEPAAQDPPKQSE